MTLGTLSTIYRYPVKSMMGESLPAATLTERGIPGDRAWAVRDEVRGGIRGAKQIAALMRLAARYPRGPQVEPSPAQPSPPADIVLENGATFSTSDDDVNEKLSAALGHTVTLWPLLPASERQHYRRGAPDHEAPEVEWRQVFARTEDEPLPDFSLFPAELMEYESPPGTYFDAFPIMALSTASLATLQARHPGSRFDVRRFRPNLLIETPSGAESPFPERDWVGKRLRVGEAVLDVELNCPRCVMTTRDFSDLPRDPKIMRALVAESGGDLGVYASVVEPGVVRPGDAIELA